MTVCTAYVLFLASVHWGIPLDINHYFWFKHLITQILCQGSINLLLFVTSKYEKRKIMHFISETATLNRSLLSNSMLLKILKGQH